MGKLIHLPGEVPKPSEGALAPIGRRESDVVVAEKAIELREGAVDLREEAADLREEAADLREEAADLREKVATRRETVVRPQEQAARAALESSTTIETHLREANERLVVATVNAQMLAEAAEGITAKMSHRAEHDILTGLPNRAVLHDRLGQSIANAQRRGEKVALMYLDLDNFKHINDRLGHAAGDMLLQSTAKRLLASVRATDTVSRQGGDEFVILLPEVEGERGATLAAEKLIDAMAEPHMVEGHTLHVTLSIGISIYPDDGTDAEAVIRNADTAMYHAKRTGRNNYQVFTSDMNIRAVASHAIELELHRALDEGGFVLHYQTQVELETGVITGAEALLRLKRPGRRLVRPGVFVTIAEESGLIVPIGRWVMREACRQAQAWYKEGLQVPRVAVNISAKELHGKGFLQSVRSVLDDTGLDPRLLELEVTESGLMVNADHTMTTLSALRAIGVRIAIDDFGKGCSSLSHFGRFPVDTVKIDPSFVHEIEGDAAATIVDAITAMGIRLDRRIVAEGIETKQQTGLLQRHRCTEGQGYFFSRPVPASRIAAVLAVRNPG
jgi:diguanylate cyclase (GGDEF)-like protein